MSKERDLLKRCLEKTDVDFDEELANEIEALLAEPEPEPVAWIIEWVKRYKYDSTPIFGRVLSFTKDNLWGVNPNYIPLYTSPPKREPLSDEAITALDNSIECAYVHEIVVRLIEKAHGIGE